MAYINNISKKVYSKPIKRTRLYLYIFYIITLKKIFDQNKLQFLPVFHIAVYEKLFRSFVISNNSLHERTDLIKNHYILAKQFFGLDFIHSLAKNKNVIIAEIIDDLSLNISYNGRFKREGEWTLSLLKNSVVLYSCVFIISFICNDESIVIGCMQGADPNELENPKEAMKEATKKLYGLKPADFLIQILFTISAHVGIKNIYGVSSSGHVYSKMIHRWFILKPDYNNFWEERNATKFNNKLYLLNAPIRKEIENIASNKRSAYKKRYLLLDSLNEKILNFFTLKKHS